jgi:hypothetical protein
MTDDDDDGPPKLHRPSEYYDPCPNCAAYLKPDEDIGREVCVACGATNDGSLAMERTEYESDEGIGPHRDDDRPRYDVSGYVRLAGGFEDPYPDGWTEDPELEFDGWHVNTTDDPVPS